MNPQLTNALITAARAFANALETEVAITNTKAAIVAVDAKIAAKTTKAAPAAKVETPAPEPVKEPEPEVTFDEPGEITLESLKAKYKPLVQNTDADLRKKYQGLVGKWMLEHGAKAISEVKAEDYAEFDAFLTTTGESA